VKEELFTATQVKVMVSTMVVDIKAMGAETAVMEETPLTQVTFMPAAAVAPVDIKAMADTEQIILTR
jgi:hypothetical protein